MDPSVNKVRLNINQITPGMKLAEPITNASGVTLMPAGIRLTPMFVLRLKKWNIETVDVFVEKAAGGSVRTNVVRPRPATASTNSGLTAEQERFARAVATEVSQWFVNVRDNPLMMALRVAAIKRLVAHGPRGLLNLMRHPEGYPAAEEPSS